VWLVAAGGLAGCLEGPVAGEVTLKLVTPYADDGAVSFSVQVAAPNELTGASPACDSCEVFFVKVSPTELRGIVVGNLGNGPIVRVGVTDAGPSQVYRIELLEAASGTFAARQTTGYDLAPQ
jgi:hypothetical protein